MNITTSASCSIDPESHRSESNGRLSSRLSTARDSCDRTSTGAANSLASAFSPRVVSEISCTRLPSPEPLLRRDEQREVLALVGPTPDPVVRHAGFFAEDAVGELLGRHFEAGDCRRRARSRRVQDDVGGECGLAHAGPAGEDDEMGGPGAAEGPVEIGKTAGDANCARVRFEGLVGAGDRRAFGSGCRRRPTGLARRAVCAAATSATSGL
jgi:hypothetical protein